jgi:hypothetical protein
MLVHLLRSHPEICAHDEVFSPDKVRGLSGKYLQRSREEPGFIEWLSAERYRDPIRFLYKFVLDPDGKKAVGFKLKHDELVLPGYETDFAFVTALVLTSPLITQPSDAAARRAAPP